MTEPDTKQQTTAGTAECHEEFPAFSRMTIIPGAVAALLGLLGLAGMYFGIESFRSIYPGFQTMAFSTAVLLILFGAVLTVGALRPFRFPERTGILALMVAIAVIEVLELPLNIQGIHFPVESLLVGVGNAIAGQPTSPISPATIVLVIVSALSLFLILARFSPANESGARDIAGVLGLFTGLAGFTFILSYLYGVPLMYGTGLIPVAAPTALAFFAVGTGLVTAAGSTAAPLRYLYGDSVRALLLRTFLPLTIIVILVATALEITRRIVGVSFNAVLTAASIVVFSLVTAAIVFRVSDRVGGVIEAAERKQKLAEEELRVKNTELESAFEELTATEEELRQNYEELARNEQALRKSESILNLTQRVTRVGGWEYDVIAKRPYWTDEVYRIHGVSKDFDPSDLEKDIRFYSPEDQETIATAFRKAMETGEPYDHELRFTTAKGEQLWVRTLGHAEWSGDKIVRVIGNIMDVTGRRQAEEAIRRADAYNRSLIEASLDPLLTINPDGTISDVNAATARATGLSRDELIGTDFSGYFTEPEKAKAGYEAVFREGAVTDYALEIRHPDGKITPVLYNATVLRNERGEVSGVFAAARDISGRKRAEEALKTERQRLYDVLETLPVYVCLLGADYRMPFANRYFRETFGEPKGRCCYDFLFNLDKPCESCETYTVMKTRARHHWYWTGPNGRDYDIYDFPFTDSDGSFMILEMGIDITEQKKAEAALQKANDELEERVSLRTAELQLKYRELEAANEELTAIHEELQVTSEKIRSHEQQLVRQNEEQVALNEELTATQDVLHQHIDELALRERDLNKALAEKEVLLAEIHHRVKNNLTAFISLLSLEGSKEETPAGILLKQELQNRARSMALIHETLYKTHMFDKVDMGMYLTTLLDQIGNSFAMLRSVKIVVDAPGVTLNIPRATPVGLIINELATNSFKYAFPPEFVLADGDCPVLRVTLSNANGEYLLSVADNGVGLPPGLDVRGTNSLGLKLVNFLARHQLRAKVELGSGKGTEFLIRFRE